MGCFVYDSSMSLPILVLVDDEPNILSALHRSLAGLPIEIRRCGNGMEALDFLQHADAHLVISDYRMPEMDGVQFLEQIRLRHPRSHRILLTAFADFRAAMDSVNRGSIHKLLTKPWDTEELLRAVRREIMESILDRLEELLPMEFSALFACSKETEIASSVSRMSDSVGLAHFGIPTVMDDLPAPQAAIATSGIVWEPWFRVLFPEAADRRRVEAITNLILEAVRVAVERQGLMRRLTRLAEYDLLSGALNRRGLELALQREAARSDRYGSPLCLVLLDLDHFKEVNDTFGHEAGDMAIRGLGKVLTAAVRNTDVVGRYGGDEFCLLFPGLGIPEAVETCGRLRSRILEWASGDEKTGKLTVSMGISSLSGESGDPESLIRNADKALYFVKNHGRGKVAWCDAEVHPVD